METKLGGVIDMKLTTIGKKLIIFSLVAAIAAGAVGCGNTKKPSTSEHEVKTPTDVPDYSDSDKKMNMYAYRGTSDGNVTNAAGVKVVYEDYKTLEQFQLYKDCGFDIMFAASDAGFSGGDFEKSVSKKVLDMCEQIGLKLVFQDQRIRDLTSSAESIIGEGKQFASMDDLVKTIREYMAPYINHPAFYGLTLVDEPSHKLFESIAEVQKALRTVKPDIYIGQALNPYFPSLSAEVYTGKIAEATTMSAYETYVNDYLEMTQATRIMYDNYPFTQRGLLTTFFANAQKVSEISAEHGATFELILQAFQHQETRMPIKEDLYFQNNAALAFGAENIMYFMYWRGSKSWIDTFYAGILDYDGSKILYDEVKEVNAYTQKMASVILNFDYEKAYVTYNPDTDITTPAHFSGVESKELDHVKKVDVTQATLITQMKDKEQNRTGYMVLNAEGVPDEARGKGKIKMTFEGYDFVTCYYGDEPQTVQLVDGVVELELNRGEAAFVIPHN